MREMGKANRFILIVLILFSISASTVSSSISAYQVSIDSIAYNKFPQLETFVSVIDQEGFPVLGLNDQDILIKEDSVINNHFQISPYSNDDEKLAVAILIDTSSSMDSSKSPTHLDNAIAAAQGFIGKLSSQDLVAVITFSDNVNVLSELTDNKVAVSSRLNSLKPDGATAMNDAIIKALDMLKSRSERKAIILITDGEPYGDQLYTFDQAFAQASISKIPIYPIGFGDVNKDQLMKLADATGGSEQIKPNSDAVSEAFDSILGVFREKYLLIVQSNILPDNKEHDLEIFVNYQGGTQSADEKFIARYPVIVKIQSLKDGDTVNGEKNIVADVDGLNAISKVSLIVDGNQLQAKKFPPFDFKWDTTDYATGRHDVKVVAEDELGFTNEDNVSVLVELQRQDWIYWLLGLIVLIALAIFIPLGLKRKQTIPQAARKALLYELEGLQVGHEWPLDQTETRLGRRVAENDIGLKGLNASRSHALIQRTRTGYYISCLNSDNPLIINGEKKEHTTLREGDILELGESTFRFEYRK